MLGKVSGVFGVRGQIKVFSYTAPRDNILNYDPWMLGSGNDWQPYRLKSGQMQGKGLIAWLEGLDDRDQAQLLVGQQIAIDESQLPAAQSGDYYWSQLEGLQVSNTDGTELGRITYLFETGSNDVLVVRGKREHLIPFIRDQVIKEIDLDAGKMIVDWDPEF